MTAGVAEWIQDGDQAQIARCLDRHQSGDWGDIHGEDRGLNEEDLRNGNRILSVYTVMDRRIWIITEADRSVTTVLFPEEY